ncbi:vacuolar membrane-associated protein iml1 [Pleosporales sp. CAS-2024a]
MSKSASDARTTRAQKSCTLWTHDDNFSRDDIVFNADKFPEISTAPGTLLQIVALEAGTAVRDFQSSAKGPQLDAHQAKDAASARAAHSLPGRSRRGSVTIAFDENGSSYPGAQDVGTERAYIFAVGSLSADLKSKYANLQISISERIAKVFGFRNRMQVIVAEADEEKHEAHHVELVFRDEYLARADMWRMATSELSKRTVYKGQKLLFMGTIKATIKHIYINGHSVHSGYFSPRSKPIFRSESARYVLFIQMSKEMWDFDAEGAGEIMFNKVVGGFLPDLFKRWLRINARHLVTIILFTRMEYNGELTTEQNKNATRRSEPKAQTSVFRDYYRVVVSDMASGDWVKILYQLKKEFRTFLREVSIVPRSANQLEHFENEGLDDPVSDSIVAGRPTSASQGNILEAINLAAAQFAKDYIDRDLVRTGISVILVTPGTGVFEVDYNMLKLTTDTLMGSGIGIDLVCLSPMPLHSVPLFKYRTPRLISAFQSVLSRKQNDRQDAMKSPSDVEDKTPRQHESVLDSLVRTSSTTALHSVAEELTAAASENPDEWRFAMPYWVDVSFWSGTADDTLELTKPRKTDRIVKRTRKKGRAFALRCRLYELQMMGILENELGDIAIPYLEEDPLHPHQTTRNTEAVGARMIIGGEAGHASSANAAGSYSSRGDRDFTEDQLDETSAAQKLWMEAYDNEVFALVPQALPSVDQRGRGDSNITDQAPDYTRDSYLSASFRSIEPPYGKTARPPPDAGFQSLMRERSRDVEGHSPRTHHNHKFEHRTLHRPRADVAQRQKIWARENSDLRRPSTRRRSGSGDSQDHNKSKRPTPSHSPAPSRAPSPSKNMRSHNVGAETPHTIFATPKFKAEPKPRPDNWFLRQISFGGNAAPAKSSIADATLDMSHGSVKPAMLTVENNQKGPIAERLASTRITSTEKPSEPIAIRTTSRADPVNSLHSSVRPIRSVETARELRPGQGTVSSQSNSVVKDPGSTFLLAGSRALGDVLPSKPTLSSSGGGAREIPRTLSPTSAIAPWAVLVNPCNPKRNSINPRNQFRRWHHVFPRTLRAGTVKWRSLCSPAAVPLTHEWFPTAEQITAEYNESPYKITQNDDDDLTEVPRSRESLIRELIAFRLSHGFQIIVGTAVSDFSGRQERALASVLAPDYMSADGDTVFMSVGNSIHQLVCVAGGEVEVKRYNRKPTTALESSAGVDTPFPYRAYIRTAFESKYTPRDITLRPPRNEYNWNFIDTFLAGYHDELSDVLRFWRARFVLIPVEIPVVNRRPLTMLTEDSEEEVRLEGIRKLTQLWQRHRYIPPEERHFQAATFKKQKDSNPLAIAYHTRDPSAVIATGPDAALLSQTESEVHTALFPNTEKYHTSSIDLKKLADDLQGEKGIQMLDRRWHWKLHYTCFLGFDLVNWLLSNFKDVETRDDAVELGNELMNKGLFIHVQKRHQFRDGNFFFQMAPEYRTPRSDPRTSWFGMRKSDKSVPSTPLSDGPRTSPLGPRSSRSRPGTGDSSSTSNSSREGEKTPTRINSPKRKVMLSRVMRYDVDSRKRSYRPEIISLHYDQLHNPDNCYHIRIDWMNVTAKLIEDAIVTWATSVEKYGLKLVEVPIAEVADIVDHHPFRSPYTVKLALQPPKAQPEAVWDSTHFSPQYAKVDQFAYHKALLRKMQFVLDMEAASSFSSDVEVSYSWGNPDYKYTQFIHRSGSLLAQITDDGNFVLLANRLAHNRAKDNNRIRHTDPYEHKKATTDGGSQSSRMACTPGERANAQRSPFSSPVVRPVQESSILLYTGLQERAQQTASTQLSQATWLTAEQVKDEVEAFCSDADQLSAFYSEALKQAPSASPRILADGGGLDDKIPSLGLPPAISVREASPANSGWILSSTLTGRGASGLADMHMAMGSGVAGRRQASETSMASMGRRGSVMDIYSAESGPRRQDSQGSLGSEGRK